MTLLETIAVIDGKIRNAAYHLQRMVRSAGLSHIDLDEVLKQSSPEINPSEYYKLRIIYNGQGIISSELAPYHFRPISSIILRSATPELDYSRKYADRSALDTYGDGLREGAIPLIIKNRFVTDTTYTNVCFRGKDGRWVTPSTPLLEGTMRQYLLDHEEIDEMDIRVSDLAHFDAVALINAMIPLGKAILPISSVNFGIFEADI